MLKYIQIGKYIISWNSPETILDFEKDRAIFYQRVFKLWKLNLHKRIVGCLVHG